MLFLGITFASTTARLRVGYDDGPESLTTAKSSFLLAKSV